MNLDNIIFIDNLPKLDLHGYDCETARVTIEDFIKDNVKLQNKFIVIVHGRGTGAIKKTTHATLKTNKYALEYKTYYYNDGCTIVNLNIEKQ